MEWQQSPQPSTELPVPLVPARFISATAPSRPVRGNGCHRFLFPVNSDAPSVFSGCRSVQDFGAFEKAGL